MALDDYQELDLTGLNVDHVVTRRSILRANYGDGYADTIRVGALGGTKAFQLSAGVWPDDEDVAAIGGDSWMEYYWQFFEDRLDNANEPFLIEWRNRKWLVDLAEPEVGVEVLTSDLFTPDGIELNMRRVRGVSFAADGSIAGPEVPTGLTLEVLSGTEILVTWDSAPDTEAPTAPVLESATADSDTEITLVWGLATDVVGVAGYQTRIDGGSWEDRGPVLTYQYTGLLPSTEYDFEVRAYDAAGNFSEASNLLSETTDAGTFDPTDITGLYIWHDAGQLSLSDNDPVSSWTDESGNGRHATAAGAQRPTFKTNIVNGLPVLRFDGTAQYLDVPSLSGLTEGEAFMVFKVDTDPPASDAQSGFWGLGNDVFGTHLPYTDGEIYDAFGTTVRKDTNISTGGGLDIGFHIYSAYSATNDWACYLDDDTTPFYSTVTNTVGFGGGGQAVIGAASNTSYKLDGDIAEFILYDHKLTAPQRASVYAYLTAKYGL